MTEDEKGTLAGAPTTGRRPVSDEHARSMAAEMSQQFGIPTSVNRFNHIVIRESDYQWLRETRPPLERLGISAPIYQWMFMWGVDIETAPDWTFDPLAVTWLRLTATLIIGLRLRQILNWLSRALARASRDGSDGPR